MQQRFAAQARHRQAHDIRYRRSRTVKDHLIPSFQAVQQPAEQPAEMCVLFPQVRQRLYGRPECGDERHGFGSGAALFLLFAAQRARQQPDALFDV